MDKSRKKGFEKFCDSLNPDISYDIIYKNIKRLRKRFLVDDEFSMPANENFNNTELNICFEKISENYCYNDFDIINQAPDNIPSILDGEISEVEIKVAIRNSKLNSAPGRDIISYEIIKYLPNIAYKWLAKFSNYIPDNGVFPK